MKGLFEQAELALVILVIFLTTIGTSAKEFHDVKMADSIMVGNQKLFLKGMGLRELSFLGIIIRVYVGGLYVDDPKQDCEKLISSDKIRSVYMNFLRHVSPSDLSRSLEEGVEKNCGSHCKDFKAKTGEIKALIPSVGSSDVLKITFDSKGTSFQLNDKTLGKIDGFEFSKTLLSVFIGDRPPTADLKNGLCGKI